MEIRRILLIRSLLSALAFVCFAPALLGQGCNEMAYAHENQIDPKLIELRQVAGKVIAPDGVGMPQTCVGIFTEAEHLLVRYVQTDENGSFEINDLPDGKYRLVGQARGFCPANAQIRLKSRLHSRKTVVVHVNVRGIDTCSYVDTSKK